ncbi:hypothetical protein E4Z66_01835 [Aliishimia ponticola]|uniref:Sulfotransferase family protein n=1 Tax=Aliishimia ponticola TaxID=2499833 RepID=A0A4S4NFG7_9RHOB|nr:hypothetical protein [Aliishimia ponticola]THH38336.1 hypothetical protein E4Z66_01835 [Aliishimia ponticola]
MSEGNELNRIILHIGAHKTASTHFHRLMRANAARLTPGDVHVAKKEDIRRNLTRQIRQMRRVFSGSGHRQDMPGGVGARMAGTAQTLFLSDENLIGTSQNLLGHRFDGVSWLGSRRWLRAWLARMFGRPLIYPHAERRMVIVSRMLSGVDQEIYIAIRNPVTFLASNYCETIRFHGYQDFAEYRRGIDAAALSWAAFIQRLSDTLPGVPITVWRQEDYPQVAPQLVARVLDVKQKRVRIPAKLQEVVRPGLSARAVEGIAALCRDKPDRWTRDEIEAIAEEFPRSESNPPPSLLTPEEAAELDAQYRDDLQTIAAMPGVTLIAP